MANQNAEIKRLAYVRKIVAYQKENEAGEKILEPEGYDEAIIKNGSLWFIEEKGE